jgi:hypothetical protein
MIYGKVRIIKRDDKGNILFDEEVYATCHDNQILLIDPIGCLNNESLIFSAFKETDIPNIVKARIRFENFINENVTKRFTINESNTIKGVYLTGENDASIH